MSKILYEQYLQESGEILSEAEFVLMEKRYSGKMRKFESYWNAMKRYGIVGLAAYAAGATAATATGGILSIPLGFILYAGYRKYSDKCKKQCNNKLCVNKCYMKACIPVIKEIDKEQKVVKSSKELDPIEKKKVLKKLNKELEKWVKRYNKYKSKVNKLQAQYKEEERQELTNANRERARYYGGEVNLDDK